MSDYYILINLKNHIEIFFFLPHISVLFAYLRSVISNQNLRTGGGQEKCKPNKQKNSGETVLRILLLINFYHK